MSWHHSSSSKFIAVKTEKFQLPQIYLLINSFRDEIWKLKLLYVGASVNCKQMLYNIYPAVPYGLEMLHLFFRVSVEVRNCYIFLYSRWTHVK